MLRELQSAPAGELGAVIDRLGIHSVLGAIKRRQRRRFLGLVTGERLPELSPHHRCEIITWLQKGWTRTNEEDAAARILLQTQGEQLQQLRDLIDGGADHYDLMHLVFDDIDSAKLRKTILNHFADEASALPRRLRPISDIDDTVYPSLHDRRYEKGQPYPGVLQFHRELLRSGGDRMVFLTARPEGRFGLLEDATHRQLIGKNVVPSTILSGTFRALRSKLSMARAKERNFWRYAQLFPEDDFIFIGDSGQGDAFFGRTLRAQAPERLRRVLIHQIGKKRPVPAENGLSYFSSYPEAAATLEKEGLLEAGAHQRCLQAYQQDGGRRDP